MQLPFVPLMAKAEYQQLKTAREEAAARFSKGAFGKSQYTRWQIRYEQGQVPMFFTKDHRIYVDRWADRGAIIG